MSFKVVSNSKLECRAVDANLHMLDAVSHGPRDWKQRGNCRRNGMFIVGVVDEPSVGCAFKVTAHRGYEGLEVKSVLFEEDRKRLYAHLLRYACDSSKYHEPMAITAVADQGVAYRRNKCWRQAVMEDSEAQVCR